MLNSGPLSPLSAAGREPTHKPVPSLLSVEGDDATDCHVMSSIDQAALALARSPPTDDDSEWSSSLLGARRLRVPHGTLDESDDVFVAGEDARASDVTLERLPTDMGLSTLPASERRAMDEVDVAAAGIPLEVRRFQCTKALLALKEATKNDATPQPAKLVDFVVSLTFGDSQICTEREMCQWLVAQMCDRMETGQVWVVAKTSTLLFALLWRGSNSFVQAMREYGTAMFHSVHISSLLQTTAQRNMSGERLPLSLQPIARARMSPAATAGRGGRPPQLLRGPSSAAAAAVPEDKVTFLVANAAFMESLCEYRVRHPTLDLAHGEILSSQLSEGMDGAEGDATPHSPAAWKEVLDDTLELMKAIAVTDPDARICAISVSVATLRVRHAVLLYQIACRALARLLHAVVTVSHTFVATLQAGLQVPSSRKSPEGTPATPSSTGSGQEYFGKDAYSGVYPDYSLTPDMVRASTQEYYFAIYQFNRTVNMLKAYCESAKHVDKETARRALAAFKTLPEASIREFKFSRRKFSHPVHATMMKLHQAAQQAAESLESEEMAESLSSRVTVSDTVSHATNATNSTTPAATPTTTATPAFGQTPLADEGVQQSMLEMYEYHMANRAYREKVWRSQVDALCMLFEERDAAMLHQVFRTGLAGLWQQWEEFTNNGAAAAEKALMNGTGSGDFATAHRDGGCHARGVSLSDNGLSGERGVRHRDNTADTLTRSSTFILRSLPAGVRLRASFGSKPDVITLNSPASDALADSSIDALLREDDVVVICNEECSCNDTLKLVDRFHVLLDVPMGKGNYGTVYRAWDEVIGCYLAAKELPLDASKAHNVAVREVLQEYTVLTELSHPNIVRVVAFMVLKQTARIYMEWMPSGSLQDVLRHHPLKMLRESVVRRYARDVLSGLAFLHSRGVIHRDVKPGNMLLSSDGAVKLTDFGTSLVLSGNHHTMESDIVTGTAAYMAPESMQGMQSSASDIWSFGCSVVQLVSGNVPWCDPTSGSPPESIALLFKIGSLDDTTHLERPHDALKAASSAAAAGRGEAEGQRSMSTVPADSPHLDDAAQENVSSASEAEEGVSAELLAMLDAIFVVDRKKRPSASELLQFSFFKLES